MRVWRRIFSLAAAALALSTAASAYYHYTRYLSRYGPFVPIEEKYDLTALVGKTVPYFISDQAPAMAAGDSYPSLVSEIRQAASVWNGVASSDLRLAFGGTGIPQTTQATPGIDIIFDELPPGLRGLTTLTVRADSAATGAGAFIPIVRAKVVLPDDTTDRPSFSEQAFGTMVHEMGHALGLQHTFTSSVMSVEQIRAVSKSKPLGADDVIGLSLLYPAAGWNASLGSISGSVTMSGAGVNLASVVAIQANGIAVSAMTQPDGSYTIEGLPQGSYYVYVHPVPPAMQGESTPGNITVPADLQGVDFPFGYSFDTQFYPGVKNYLQSYTVAVQAGARTNSVNFHVTRRNYPGVYLVRTYGYFGSVYTAPAFLDANQPNQFLVAAGAGLVSGSAPTPGLGVAVMGTSASIAPGGIHSYSMSSQYIELDFSLNSFSGAEGPRHLVFSANSDIYVLPSGFIQTQKLPPQVSSLTAGVDSSGNRALIVDGANLFTDTRILFDGQAGTVRSASTDATQLVVTPPPAAPGQRAAVAAFNSDGQSSLFLQGFSPATYTYDPGDPAQLTLSPASIPAGVETMVDITGSGVNFDATAALGFGSSDVSVRRLWTVASNHLVANVVVAPGATPASLNVTLASGLQLIPLPGAFQVQLPNPRQVVLSSQLINLVTGQSALYAGWAAILPYSAPVPLSAAGLQLSVGGQPAQILNLTASQITFLIPAALTPGTVAVHLTNGSDLVYPIAIQIDPPPPVVAALTASNGTAIDALHPAHTGDVITLLVTSVGDTAANLTPDRVAITVGGVDHPALAVAPADQTDSVTVQFVLSAVPLTPAPTLSVSIDGRRSLPVPIAIAQ